MISPRLTPPSGFLNGERNHRVSYKITSHPAKGIKTYHYYDDIVALDFREKLVSSRQPSRCNHVDEIQWLGCIGMKRTGLVVVVSHGHQCTQRLSTAFVGVLLFDIWLMSVHPSWRALVAILGDSHKQEQLKSICTKLKIKYFVTEDIQCTCVRCA